MKKVVLVLMLLASISLSSFAASNQARDGRQGDRLYKELNLTPAQTEQVKKINTEFKEKADAVKLTRITAEMQREKIETLRNEQKLAIEKVLTADQKASLEKMRAARTERTGRASIEMRDKDKENKSEFNFADLDLTDSQKEKMKTLREEYKGKQQTESQGYWKAVREILTPEQQTKLKTKMDNKTKEGRKTTTKDK